MRIAIAVVAILTTSLAATAKIQPEVRPTQCEPPNESSSLLWHDDLEIGAPGSTHGDFTEDVPVAFHVTSYLTYDDPDHETDYSWWCGEQNPAFAGGDGYANDWGQRLELPPIILGAVATEKTSLGAIKALYRVARRPETTAAPTRSAVPVLTFRYRHDSEAGYDITWVEVESLGSWVPLNAGFDGSSGGWQDLGAGGFGLAGYGDPIKVRFRFVSDDAYSDEDAYYNSLSGAFHVDDICVHDAITGEILYWEDSEGGAGWGSTTIRSLY